MSKTSAAAAKALTSSHFELFGLAPAFALDSAQLERAYRDIQARVHPDKFAHAGDAERRASMQMTTRVNEAYRTLRSPVRRAKYLLELNGVDVAFETETAMPKDFLMRQLELRERIETAKTGSDLDALSRELSSSKKQVENQIQHKVDQERDFQSAKGLVRELMFFERLAEEVDAAHEALES